MQDFRKYVVFHIYSGILWFFLFPQVAFATSASIAVSGSEGAISLQATASFSSYILCDNSTPPNCRTVDSGLLKVYHNGGHVGSASGNGSASFDTMYDGGGLIQGEHVFFGNSL